ncbi:phage tail family protein [Kribbella sp. NBC_01505]|uniref:hypothetical protein n=1 Tax=Kribbella sp. NBC_01505 TaxID=2903580 RepID=UPI00386EE6E6
MPKLVLKSNVSEGILDLDSLLREDDPLYQNLPMEMHGVQALAGVTGLGLPSLATQWLEGAGDGARFRGRRVLPRDIDLPLYFDGKDRDGLKALMSRLATILAGQCELRIVEDDDTYWYVTVHRVGGGSFVYGADTIGERDLLTVITLRAGDPFWISNRMSSPVIKASGAGRGLLNGSLTALKVKSSQAFGSVLLTNNGDAPAYPLWEITGPGNSFKSVSPSGEILQWNGTLSSTEKLYIDSKTSRVYDATGANRFAELAPAPRMWMVPPGISNAQVTLQGASAIEGQSMVRITWQDRKWMVI